MQSLLSEEMESHHSSSRCTVALSCCRQKEVNRLCVCVTPPREEASTRSIWCRSGAQYPNSCAVTHLWENVLTRIEIMVPTLYLITEMLTQSSRLALICQDCRLGNEEEGVFLKVISTTAKKTEYHVPCICALSRQE